MRGLPILALAVFMASCRGEPSKDGRQEPEVTSRFTHLPSEYTGVRFTNTLTDTERFNVLTYRNYYDGGGVALGDFNQDGLLDIFLTSNQEANRLFLNRGEWWFEDRTALSDVGGRRAWSTGVAVTDVNGDGLPDIYVCNSGDVPGDDRANELFINLGPDQEGVPRFEDQAEAFGLADTGYSTHATFFDYDRDGDLDVYILNNSSRPITSFRRRQVRALRNADGGDRLYRNDGDSFTDVSQAAGIHGSEIGFGLSVTVGDYDRDGWPDIYVANDFFERDYLYRNLANGAFQDLLESAMGHISQSSMGADMGDINNDGIPDYFVTDMLPAQDSRTKVLSTFDSWQAYQAGLDDDFHHQVMRNTLQLGRGDGSFAEIGHALGVAATDWSWSALIADFDLDGRKDIHVTNGIFRDLTDQDFLAYFEGDAIRNQIRSGRRLEFMELIERIPSRPIPNVLFHNTGSHFEDRASDWGLEAPGWSNGAAYGDLDNDGDLDLVVNNVNQPAGLFRNETVDRDWLQIVLRGQRANTDGIGATATVYGDSGVQVAYQMPNRGFQSSVTPVLNFGLPAPADSVEVIWPDGARQVRIGPVRGRLSFVRSEAGAPPQGSAPGPDPATGQPTSTWFRTERPLGYAHVENDYNDFERQALLLKMVSREGPRLAVGDLDGDGLEDVFVGGAKGFGGAAFIARGEGFREVRRLQEHATSEDVGAALFDADGDGLDDLFVVSGGNEFSINAPALQDRLYLGPDLRSAPVPGRFDSGSVAAPQDVDGDGDLDLFVPSRLVPWQFGIRPEHRLLRNDGAAGFRAETVAESAGMISDGVWADLTGDGVAEMVVVGPWEPLVVLDREFNTVSIPGLDSLYGWWLRVHAADVDSDGDTDLLLGNLGTNTELRAPATMSVGDFDRNGWVEQLIAVRGRPFPLRQELLAAMPSLEALVPSHAEYATMSYPDFVQPVEDRTLRIDRFESLLAENTPDGFRIHPLPFPAQWTATTAFASGDLDGDGRVEVVAAGNYSAFQPRIGPLDTGVGLVFRFSEGVFETVPESVHGLRLNGEVRDLALLKDGRLVVARSNGPASVWDR